MLTERIITIYKMIIFWFMHVDGKFFTEFRIIMFQNIGRNNFNILTKMCIFTPH